jgi:hypothetical protein
MAALPSATVSSVIPSRPVIPPPIDEVDWEARRIGAKLYAPKSNATILADAREAARRPALPEHIRAFFTWRDSSGVIDMDLLRQGFMLVYATNPIHRRTAQAELNRRAAVVAAETAELDRFRIMREKGAATTARLDELNRLAARAGVVRIAS